MRKSIKEKVDAAAPNSNSPPNPPKLTEPPNPDPLVVVNILPVELDTLGSGGNSPKPPPQY